MRERPTIHDVAAVPEELEPVPFVRRIRAAFPFVKQLAHAVCGVLSHYVEKGVQALDPAELPPLLKLKYGGSLQDAVQDLGPEIGEKFTGFQRYLYEDGVAG